MTAEILDVLSKSKTPSQRVAVVRQRRINRMFYFCYRILVSVYMLYGYFSTE